MNVFKRLPQFLLLTAFFLAPLSCSSENKVLTEKEKIEALIRHLEGLKDATFIRNGSSYDAKTAAKFLRRKWEAQAEKIKTADEFIEKLASVSSTSGKPYLIRLKDGKETKAGEYLKGELKKIQPSPGTDTKSG